MNQLIDYLKLFNSKERFYLLGYLLGNPNFSLGPCFRQNISDLINVKIPPNAFSAMDYHIDWIYASLYLANNEDSKKAYLNEDRIIKGQQEDTDWLIAFELQKIYHIILIETKLTSPWKNTQMDSKATRYREIFGDKGDFWENVIPHFVCLSPTKPIRLEIDKWPKWMKSKDDFFWLAIPKPDILYKVTRCDENGLSTSDGIYWKIEAR